MFTDINTARLLGAAQLAVFGASMLSERLLASAIGSGSMSDRLVHMANNLTRMRIGNVVALLNCIAIIVLGVLFYIVFHNDYKIIALVALLFFVAEAITLAVSKIGAYGLIPLSQGFVEAGAPESSHFQTLGTFLYQGVDRVGYDLHMLFFCLGGILWYYLFYASGYLPRALSLWGTGRDLLADCPGRAGALRSGVDLRPDPRPALCSLRARSGPVADRKGVWLIGWGLPQGAVEWYKADH